MVVYISIFIQQILYLTKPNALSGKVSLLSGEPHLQSNCSDKKISRLSSVRSFSLYSLLAFRGRRNVKRMKQAEVFYYCARIKAIRFNRRCDLVQRKHGIYFQDQLRRRVPCLRCIVICGTHPNIETNMLSRIEPQKNSLHRTSIS